MLMVMLMLHAAAAAVAAAGEGGGEEEDKRAWRRMTKCGVRRRANAYMVLEGCPDRVPASRGHTYGSHGPY